MRTLITVQTQKTLIIRLHCLDADGEKWGGGKRTENGLHVSFSIVALVVIRLSKVIYQSLH